MPTIPFWPGKSGCRRLLQLNCLCLNLFIWVTCISQAICRFFWPTHPPVLREHLQACFIAFAWLGGIQREKWHSFQFLLLLWLFYCTTCMFYEIWNWWLINKVAVEEAHRETIWALYWSYRHLIQQLYCKGWNFKGSTIGIMIDRFIHGRVYIRTCTYRFV